MGNPQHPGLPFQTSVVPILAMAGVSGGAGLQRPGGVPDQGTHLVEVGMGTIFLALPGMGREGVFGALFPVPTLAPTPGHFWSERQENSWSPLPKATVATSRPWRPSSSQALGGYTLGPAPRRLGEEALLCVGFPNTHYSLLFWHLVSCTVPISSGIKVSLLRTSVLWTYSRPPSPNVLFWNVCFPSVWLPQRGGL